ncbi:MAG: hypothetical protein LBV08_06565 [Clostridiales bacterium]|nr:hypothetical protein [Clostridiales bacterium]
MKHKLIVLITIFCFSSIFLNACQQSTPNSSDKNLVAESASPDSVTIPSSNTITETGPLETGKVAVSDTIDTNGLNEYWKRDGIQFPADSEATLSLYVGAEKNSDGNFSFDDGQDWLLILETKLGSYQIFPRQYVQLGGVSCSVFNDEENVFHILVTVQQTAGYQIFDYIFDENSNTFEQTKIYDAGGINFIFEEHWNDKI